MMDNRRTIFIGIGAALVFCAMAAVILFTSIMVRRQSKELAGLSEMVKTELTGTSSAITSVKENLILLTRDTGEIRQVLNLPQISYPLLDTVEEERREGAETNLEFFQSVDLLLERYISTKNAAYFQESLKSSSITSFCKKRGLRIDVMTELSASISRDDEPYFSLVFLPAEKLFSLSDFTGRTGTAANPDEIAGLLEEMYPLAEQHLKSYKSSISALSLIHTERELANVLGDKKFTFSPVTEGPEKASSRLLYDSTPFLTVGVKKESLDFFIENTAFSSYENFIHALKETILTLDTRTEADKLIDEQKKRLLDLQRDGGFQLLLDNNNLVIAEHFREDSDYLYLDISDRTGSLVGAFAIQKLFGEVYLTDSEDIPISALKTIGLAPSNGAEKKN